MQRGLQILYITMSLLVREQNETRQGALLSRSDKFLVDDMRRSAAENGMRRDFSKDFGPF